MNKCMSYRAYQGRRKWGWLRALLAAIMAAALCFLIPLGVVLAGDHSHISNDPQIMVIFGCQVMPWGPSALLQDRLDMALDYLEDHPDMTVVVTGGQGDNEHVSEAQCMYDYLTGHGVHGGQILLEDQSHNTKQNVDHTIALLKAEGYGSDQQVLLVSNGFHLARIRMLWGRVGRPEQISTLAAPSSHGPTQLWMYVREPLALIKSFFLD